MARGEMKGDSGRHTERRMAFHGLWAVGVPRSGGGGKRHDDDDDDHSAQGRVGKARGRRAERLPGGGGAPPPPVAPLSLHEITGHVGELLRVRQRSADVFREEGDAHGQRSSVGASTDRAAAGTGARTSRAQAAWRAYEAPAAVSWLVEDVVPRDSGGASRPAATPRTDREADPAKPPVRTAEEVVIVFGKRLVRDQITYEYAIRIMTLVRHLITGRLAPSILCFTGGYDSEQSLLSEAAAGYLYFRHVCEELGVDLSPYSIMLEERHIHSGDSMSIILQALRQQVAGAHVILLSSDYHLMRIREVEARVPSASFLAPLRELHSRLSYAYATYPYALSADATTAFMGRAIVAAAELSIFIVAMRAHLDKQALMDEELLQRFQDATGEIGRLSEQCLQVPSAEATPGCAMAGTVAAAAAAAPEGRGHDLRAVREALEGAYLELRAVCRPLEAWAGGKSVPGKAELQSILERVIRAEQQVRRSADPDRPLSAAEWYRLPLAFLGPLYEKQLDHFRGDPEAASDASHVAAVRRAGRLPPFSSAFAWAEPLRHLTGAVSDAHSFLQGALHLGELERQARRIAAENLRRMRAAQAMRDAPTHDTEPEASGPPPPPAPDVPRDDLSGEHRPPPT